MAAASAPALLFPERRSPTLVLCATDEARVHCATCDEACKASEMVHFDELDIAPVCPGCADELESELNEEQGQECCALGCYRCLPDAGVW